MTFPAIFFGLILFCLGFAIHVIVWRLRRPHDDIRALALCLVVLPCLAASGAGAAGLVALSVREILSSALLVVFLAASYIVYYPAAQAPSPTMLLMVSIGKAGRTGLDRERMAAALDDEILCRDSIRNLTRERFAEQRDGRLLVAARGALLLRVLDGWRGLIGLTRGRG